MLSSLLAAMVVICGDGLPPQWLTGPTVQPMISPDGISGVFITMSVYDPDGMESLLGSSDGPSHWTEAIYPPPEGATVLGYGAFDGALPGDYTFHAIATDLCGDTTEISFTFTVPASAGLGDMNCDGVVDTADINFFNEAITCAYANPCCAACWDPNHTGCPFMNADINGDGTVDIDDVSAFVALLTGQ